MHILIWHQHDLSSHIDQKRKNLEQDHHQIYPFQLVVPSLGHLGGPHGELHRGISHLVLRLQLHPLFDIVPILVDDHGPEDREDADEISDDSVGGGFPVVVHDVVYVVEDVPREVGFDAFLDHEE